ncbi:MAG: AMIN domain-containing protein, partial [Cyanobacteria bacterium HKST-UBA05]|nr:AMIN domain-containing protein [Cyanobacteria bacterium HKST-UBA05]
MNTLLKFSTHYPAGRLATQTVTALMLCMALGVSSVPAGAQMAMAPQPQPQPQPQTIPVIPQQQWISDAYYNDRTGHLIIYNQSGQPLQAQNIVQSPRNQEISFYLPNAAVQPSPKQLRIAPDPLIKGISLEQRALNGMPSVKVTVSLYTESPYVPFSIVPQSPGLNVYLGKIAFAHPEAPAAQPAPTRIVASAPINTAIPAATAVRPMAAPAPQPIAPARPTIAATQPRPMAAAVPIKPSVPPVANRPLPPALAQTANVTTYGPAVQPQAPRQQQSALTYAPAPAVAQVAAKGAYGIDDIFYDNNIVTLSSKTTPLLIDRVFTLNGPNRYIIDIATTSLNPDLLDRVIPNLHPSIAAIRVSQFDIDTARLVIQFAGPPQQVVLTQSADRR